MLYVFGKGFVFGLRPLFRLAVDDDVVEVTEAEAVGDPLQDLVDESSETAWGILQTERHLEEAILTTIDDEGRLLDVFFTDLDSEIALATVQSAKDGGALEAGQVVLDVANGCPLLLRKAVQGSEVNAYTPLRLVGFMEPPLRHNDEGKIPRGRIILTEFNDDFVLDPLDDLFINDLIQHRRGFAGFDLDRLRVPCVNPVLHQVRVPRGFVPTEQIKEIRT